MEYRDVEKYFLKKPEAVKEYPFGPEVAVFKIKGKMFATLAEEKGVAQINLKCDPQEALALRDIFESIIPGYYMNKKHWNTVILDGSVPAFEIIRMIDNSYSLVVKGLKKSEKQLLELRHSKIELYGK